MCFEHKEGLKTLLQLYLIDFRTHLWWFVLAPVAAALLVPVPVLYAFLPLLFVFLQNTCKDWVNKGA